MAYECFDFNINFGNLWIVHVLYSLLQSPLLLITTSLIYVNFLAPASI